MSVQNICIILAKCSMSHFSHTTFLISDSPTRKTPFSDALLRCSPCRSLLSRWPREEGIFYSMPVPSSIGIAGKQVVFRGQGSVLRVTAVCEMSPFRLGNLDFVVVEMLTLSASMLTLPASLASPMPHPLFCTFRFQHMVPSRLSFRIISSYDFGYFRHRFSGILDSNFCFVGSALLQASACT